MHEEWLWQFSMNLPINRSIIDDILKRGITYLVSAFPYSIAIFTIFPMSSSDDKNSSILKNQAKVKDISLTLFSLLPSLRFNVKNKTRKASNRDNACIPKCSSHQETRTWHWL